MNTRKDIYSQLKTQLTFEDFCKSVFWHPVGDHKRLSHDGFIFLKSRLRDQCHEVDVFKKLDKSTMPGKHFIFLARFCRKPYYIGTNKIFFFDEEEAFLFKLCDGDIDNVKEVAPEKLK